MNAQPTKLPGTGEKATPQQYQSAPRTTGQPPQMQTMERQPVNTIEQEYAARRASDIAQLRSRAGEERRAVEERMAQIEPAAQQAKTDVDVRGMQTAKKLQELMSARGIGTGDTRQAQQMQAGVTQQAMTDIDVQKARDIAAAQSQIDTINRTLSGNIAALGQGYSADILAAQRAQQESDRAFGLQQAQMTGMYQGLPTLQGQQLQMQQQGQQFDQMIALRAAELQQAGFNADQAYRQAQMEMQQAGLTGMYQGQQTLGAQQQAIDNQIRQRQLGLQAQGMAQDEAYRQAQLELQQSGVTGMYQGAPTMDALAAQQQGVAELPDVKLYNDVIEQRFFPKDTLGNSTYDEIGLRQYLTDISAAGVPDETVLYLAQNYGITPTEPFTPGYQTLGPEAASQAQQMYGQLSQ